MNDVNSVCQQSPSSLSPNGVGGNSGVSSNVGLSAFSSMLPNLEERSKKSQNMTECVPVPSSEHVAEIVGRQGKLQITLPRVRSDFVFVPIAMQIERSDVAASGTANQRQSLCIFEAVSLLNPAGVGRTRSECESERERNSLSGGRTMEMKRREENYID